MHLLLIVKILRVGLLRRSQPLAALRSHRTLATLHPLRPVMPLRAFATFLRRHRRSIVIAVIFNSGQGRPNQLTIREVFPFRGFAGRYGTHNSILHRGANLGYTLSRKLLGTLIDQRRRELLITVP